MTAQTQAAIERLVRRAGRMSMAAYGTDRGRKKADLTWVTRTDLAVEHLIRQGLHDLIDVRVFGEEARWSGETNAACIAIVDPIDGTEAYRHQMPFWGVSLAVFERSGDEWTAGIGVFQMPACGHTFVGRAGESLWNGKRLRTPATRSPIPGESYLGVSSDAHHWNLSAYPGKIRAFGASGLQMVLVATGMLQATLLTRYYVHDIAAAAMVLWGAGGRLYQLDKEMTPTRLVNDFLRDQKSRSSVLVGCHPGSIDDMVRCRFRER